MKIILTGVLVASLVALFGCATYQPIVDTGAAKGDYPTDLTECRQIATQANPVVNAAAGAGAGAIIGALFGAVVCGRHCAEFGARVGAVNGGINGAVGTAAEQNEIVRRCMLDRGYSLLN